MLAIVPEALQSGCRILVPGCGAGWDVAALATRWTDCEVLGLDISTTAVGIARTNCRGLLNQEIRMDDFLSAGFRESMVGRIDFLWEHTCFCAIPPESRRAYAESAATVLVPGGVLVGAFFLTLDDENDGPPWNCPAPELKEIFRPWFEIEELLPAPLTYPGREGEEWLVRMRRNSH